MMLFSVNVALSSYSVDVYLCFGGVSENNKVYFPNTMVSFTSLKFTLKRKYFSELAMLLKFK